MNRSASERSEPGGGESRRGFGSVRPLLALALPHWRRIGAALLLILGASVVSLALPLGVRELLNNALSQGEARTLHLLGLGLLLLFVGRVVVSFFGSYILRITGERIVVDLRKRLYAHLHALELSYFFEQRVGDLLSRLHNDTDSIRQAVTSLVVSGSLQIFKLGGAIAVMFALDPTLCWIVLLMAPAATFVSRRFGDLLHRIAEQVQDRLARSSALAQEGLSTAHLVQAFGRGPHEASRYAASMEDLYTAARHEARASAGFTSVVNFLAVLSTVVIFWYGGSQVLGGRLQVGDVVAFLFYAEMISQCIGMLAEQYVMLRGMGGATRRVFEILETEPRIADAPDAVTLAPSRGSVSFRQVSFRYPSGEEVLRGVSFDVEPGETVAIVGASGVGKTTLLSLLPRLFEPDSGSILIDGSDIGKATLLSLREQLALVPQDPQMLATSVRENIRYGRLDATDAEVEAAATAANAHEFVARLPAGYDTEVGERGVKLSGGQRQRIAIARALLRGAPILILDEATSSVDSLSEAMIQDALKRLQGKRTTFVAAHRLATVLSADRILVLDGGRIVGDGRHQELLERPGLYRRLVQTHFRDQPAAGQALRAAQG